MGYDYGTFAADLNTSLEYLDLEDVVPAGRYLGACTHPDEVNEALVDFLGG